VWRKGWPSPKTLDLDEALGYARSGQVNEIKMKTLIACAIMMLTACSADQGPDYAPLDSGAPSGPGGGVWYGKACNTVNDCEADGGPSGDGHEALCVASPNGGKVCEYVR
jgi:hypothetical protein